MKPRLRPTARAAAAWVGLLALAGTSPAAAGQVVFHVTDLGTLGGSSSFARGLNDEGAVVGESLRGGNDLAQAFLWSNGTMTRLGLPDATSSAWAINNAGTVVGLSAAAPVLFGRPPLPVGLGSTGVATGINGQGTVVGHNVDALGINRAFVRQANGTTVGLSQGALAGAETFAWATNDNFDVAGAADAGNGRRARLWRAGVTLWADTAPASQVLDSQLLALNSQGDAVGYSQNAFGFAHAHAWRNGAWQQLSGDENPGPFDFDPILRTSLASGINDAGQIVGRATQRAVGGDPLGPPLAEFGFLHAEGGRTRLDTVLAAGSGVKVADALAINRHGQIAAQGDNGHALLLTPAGFVSWRGGALGSFTDTAAWDSGGLGFGPGKFLVASIDGAARTTVQLTGNAQAASVLLGAGNTGAGTMTLQLAGGRLVADLVVGTRGELTGAGTVQGAITNLGVVRTQAGSTLGNPVDAALLNHGLVTGNGVLRASLHNAAGGSLVVQGDSSFELAGSGHRNLGQVRVLAGSTLDVRGGAFDSSGSVALGGTLQTVQGLNNDGTLSLSGTAAVLRGSVHNQAGGRIELERLGQALVAGSLVNDALVVAGSASTLRYEGAVSGSGDFSAGTGARHVFAGSYAPGSAGAAAVSLSQAEFTGLLQLDIGGLANGVDSDLVSFTSNVWFDPGSRVEVVLIGGYMPVVGDRFTLFDFAREPATAAAGLSLPGLAPGLAWDTRFLFSDGSLAVAAVPEPASAVLALAGLCVLWRRRCVRCQPPVHPSEAPCT